MKEIDREIWRFSEEYADDVDYDVTLMHHETDANAIVSSCKAKLDKTRENINTKMKDVGNATR